MAKASALDHLVLVVSDVERSLAWYQHHLGLDDVRLEEWREGRAPFPSLRVDANTIIDIIPGDPGPISGPDQANGRLDHLCFVVSAPDLEALRRAGELVIIDEGPRFGARGMAESIYVHDPDGLTVEIRAYPV